MTNARLGALALLLGLSSLLAAAAGTRLAQGGSAAHRQTLPEKWLTFRSKSYGYTVDYPADWHLLTEGTSEFDVVNYEAPKDDLGILFHPEDLKDATPDDVAAEAEIGVNIHPEDVQTVDEWIIQELPDEPIQKDEKLRIARIVPNGCLALRRLSAKDDIRGNVLLDSYYYCTTRAGLFEILLTYRPDNPHKAELQALGLKVAMSLRVH